MRKMQDHINEQASKYKKQPVQFVDPMQNMYFGDDEDFEPDDGGEGENWGEPPEL